MPIEINELHIKVTVNQPAPAGGEGSSTPPAKAGTSDDKLLADAVEQTLRILKKAGER
ncbi:MAG: DUF5908 family protein [Bacteroidia bacterium]|nr:DUF5908 family protein [Bacteroidia bacterium]